MPFLLAARAQALVSLTALQSNTKAHALFADGLASSFEAYIETRSSKNGSEIDDVVPPPQGFKESDISWYLNQISAALPRGDAAARARHPKVQATIQRSLAHWRQGEKVLIFCFYRATGRALREHLSLAVAAELSTMASQRFGITAATTQDLFTKLATWASSRLRRDSPGGRHIHDRGLEIGKAAGLKDADAANLADNVLRYLRTPAYLVRYVDLTEDSGVNAVAKSFDIKDDSGLTLGDKLFSFGRRIVGLTDEERNSLWAALRGFKTGSRRVDGLDTDDPDEVTPEGVMLLPNVHLANGETDDDFRQRLMLTFNTPFLPDILIASSVMAEGVDLHRECRHVIHHDLDWNPSTLEQRTGRVDRIGSKSALTGQPILVCEPYVAGTQDEKQYKVVKDRERWFGVLMGGRVPDDELSTDQIAARVPLPEELLQALTLDLSIWPHR
jgi:hypothetical protein